MNYSKTFKNTIDNINIIYQSIKNQLMVLPKGNLKIYHHSSANKVYAVFVYYPPDGERIYIKKNEKLLRDLALKMFLEKELQYLEALISVLKSGIMIDAKSSISSIRSELPPEILPYLSLNTDKQILNSSENILEKQLEEWNNKPSHANPYEPGERKHRTSDGKYVRSKSELIIYEKLLQYKINFKYEAPLTIGNITYYPDFTIMLPNGKIFFWEHAGMMHIEKYRLRHKKKMDIYESADIVPWKNLIVTYDDEDGNIDIRIVENEIKLKLLG